MESLSAGCVPAPPDTRNVTPSTPAASATRQALFPVPEQAAVPWATLAEAEKRIQALGFSVVRITTGQWLISWPGSALKIWRYSPAEVCQFARDQAMAYARRCARGSTHTSNSTSALTSSRPGNGN